MQMQVICCDILYDRGKSTTKKSHKTKNSADKIGGVQLIILFYNVSLVSSGFCFLRLTTAIRAIPTPKPATPLMAIAPPLEKMLPITVGTEVSAVFLLLELPKAT